MKTIQVRNVFDEIHFADLAVTRCPQGPLTCRAWELRHGLRAHDALFVALAEALQAPLVTCDSRLAAAPGHSAEIELYEPAGRPPDEQRAAEASETYPAC